MQKRREELARELRRSQIEGMFRQRREELLQGLKYSDVCLAFKTSELAHRLTAALDDINSALRTGEYQLAVSVIEFVVQAAGERRREVSIFLQLLGAKLRQLLADVIQNSENLDEKHEWAVLPANVQLKVLEKLFEVLSLLNYSEIDPNNFLSLLLSVWLVFSSPHIQILSPTSSCLLGLLLQTVKRMLEGRNEAVLKDLKAVGLGNELCKIIQNETKQLTEQQEADLIEIIELYMEQELHFADMTSNSINGVQILGLESHEKQSLMAYCLYLLDRKREALYPRAIRCLTLIFQRHEYLCDSIPINYVKRICELINHPQRHMQVAALELLNDIVFYSTELDQLSAKMFLPNLLLIRLNAELKQHDKSTRSVVERSGDILCNLSLTRNRDLKKEISSHSIWELAYHNIVQSSPLFPLVSVFEYYFEILPRKTAFQVLESYLASVGQLEFKLLSNREYQAIKRTIFRIYTHVKDFWPEGMEQACMNLIRQNRLNFLLQDIMQIEEEGSEL